MSKHDWRRMGNEEYRQISAAWDKQRGLIPADEERVASAVLHAEGVVRKLLDTLGFLSRDHEEIDHYIGTIERALDVGLGNVRRWAEDGQLKRTDADLVDEDGEIY